MMCNIIYLYWIIIFSEFLKNLTQNIGKQSNISLCWPQMLPDKTGCFWGLQALIWLAHVRKASPNVYLHQSDGHIISFKITGKQACFWFLCYQTRHQNFKWKHGYFIEFLILRWFVHCTFTVAMYEYHWKIIYVQNTSNSCYYGGCYQTRHKH